MRIILALIVSFLLFSNFALADAVPGDVIVTLGESLTEEQKQKILAEMEVPEDALMITVTNEEEHQYLGKYIPKAQIGSKALSSTKITLKEKNTGLVVQTNNINWVTREMFTNALITAGVKDADIYITAPFEVSGTAALTGLIKAYEISTDTIIPEEQKQVANEEMVKSAQLAESIGTEEASTLITRIKEELAIQTPETEEEMRALIEQVANELGITLSETEMNGLVSLFMRMKDINIDWNQVGNQLSIAQEKFTNFIATEEGQNLLQQARQFFQAIFDVIMSLFGGSEGTA